jgi:hypothetical protein
LTPEGRETLERRAAQTKRVLSDYCREVLLSPHTAPLPSAVDPALVNALVVAITREGTNLNQMMRIANERRDLPSVKALAEILALIKASLEKVLAL